MDKNEVKHFKKLLYEEKEKREDSLEDERMGHGISIRDLTGELSSYDNHPGDLGNETFEAEKNVSFRTRDKFLLSEIQVALNKINEGTYGLCEICHNEIDKGRLDVRPYSRLCINCEKEVGDKVQNEEKGRPIEEQVLYPPFGRSFTDNSVKDSVQFDGEDTWESVNEYNVRMSDNEFGEDESVGYVEDVEQISNDQYRKQLE
ncbi:MAG: TraR/DksA C4-type zinc finger protein [Clostridiaceae bacterium]|nr:TraR/DksA C4-type zinc finger protein [Clostridiaceae bacterium]